MAAAAVAILAQRRLQEQEQEAENQRQRESNARRITMMEAPPAYPGTKRYGIMVYERIMTKYDYIVRSSENADDIKDALASVIIAWVKGYIKVPNLLVFCTDKDPDLMNWDILTSLPGDKRQITVIVEDGYLVRLPATTNQVLIDMGRIISLDSKALTALYKSKGGRGWSWFTSFKSKQMFLLKDLVKDIRFRSELKD